MFLLYDILRYTTSSKEQEAVDNNQDFWAVKFLGLSDFYKYSSDYNFKGNRKEDYKVISKINTHSINSKRGRK